MQILSNQSYQFFLNYLKNGQFIKMRHEVSKTSRFRVKPIFSIVQNNFLSPIFAENESFQIKRIK